MYTTFNWNNGPLLLISMVVCVFSYAPEATKCLERKRETTLKLESKIEAGIERYIHTKVLRK